MFVSQYMILVYYTTKNKGVLKGTYHINQLTNS